MGSPSPLLSRDGTDAIAHGDSVAAQLPLRFGNDEDTDEDDDAEDGLCSSTQTATATARPWVSSVRDAACASADVAATDAAADAAAAPPTVSRHNLVCDAIERWLFDFDAAWRSKHDALPTLMRHSAALSCNKGGLTEASDRSRASSALPTAPQTALSSSSSQRSARGNVTRRRTRSISHCAAERTP